MLEPWNMVFEVSEMKALVEQLIVPKLQTVLQDFCFILHQQSLSDNFTDIFMNDH